MRSMARDLWAKFFCIRCSNIQRAFFLYEYNGVKIMARLLSLMFNNEESICACLSCTSVDNVQGAIQLRIGTST